LASLTLLLCVWPSAAFATNLTPVDLEDDAALEASASQAFYQYLQAIEAGELADAYDMVLDPLDMTAQDSVMQRLSSFIKARQKSPVSNEAMIVRSSGDWALVVYQYDTMIAGKAARVITTAWMMQWEGFWRQFIVAPAIETFWEEHRSDYEVLQKWFDDHAEDLGRA
jgi:DNA-binding protein Fis